MQLISMCLQVMLHSFKNIHFKTLVCLPMHHLQHQILPTDSVICRFHPAPNCHNVISETLLLISSYYVCLCILCLFHLTFSNQNFVCISCFPIMVSLAPDQPNPVYFFQYLLISPLEHLLGGRGVNIDCTPIKIGYTRSQTPFSLHNFFGMILLQDELCFKMSL